MSDGRPFRVGCLGVSLLAMSLVMSGCGQGTAASTPTTGTASPTPTTAPAVSATTGPQGLADAKDLHLWIDDFVHAYGGTVSVNGVGMNPSQLLAAVVANPDRFIERKTIKGGQTPFFVVNGAPVAIESGGMWRPILARDISDAVGGQFAMPASSVQIWNTNFAPIIQNANVLTITQDIDTSVVFKDWTTDDWRSVLGSWGSIKTQLDSGQIPNAPNGRLYDWSKVDQIVQFAQKNHMGIRAQHLVWNGDVPDSIYTGGFTKDELLKVLEFTVSVKLIKYKGVISEWNAEDELTISEYSTDKWGFWQQHVGLMDATRLSASTIRNIDPAAKIAIADDHELEERFFDRQPDLGNHLMTLIKTLKQQGLIDRVDIESNLWAYDLPSQAYMESYLRGILAQGIELAAAEITVCPTTSFPLYPGTRPATTTVTDTQTALAEGYRRTVQAYVNVGADNLGLGDVADETSAYNWLQPGTNPAAWDTQWKPKMAYYEILKVMYAGFLK